RRAGGQLIHDHEPRHQGGGQRLGQCGAGRGDVEGRVGARDIADQQGSATGGPSHRGGAATDPGQVHQGGVNLAEFDAPAANLDLVVGPSDEVQTKVG